MGGPSSQTVDISFGHKLRLYVFGLWYALIICLKNIIFSFWRPKTIPAVQERPQSWLLSQGIGHHMFIKVNGVKLHYVEYGSRDLPLVLLLHGFPDCWLGWRHQIKPLSKTYRVVAIDLKGFGDSEKPVWRGNYKVSEIIRELAELINVLGGGRCTLIGHDLGALLGWFLVAQHHELVDKFVAISAPHPNIYWTHLSNGKGLNSKFIALCQMPVVAEAEVRKEDLAYVESFYKHLIKTKETELLRAYKYVFSRTKDVTGPLNYYRNLPLKRLTTGKITVPTLLLLGTQDPYVTVEAMVRSSQFLENFEMKMVDGVGHFPHQEDFEQVNLFLLTFLQDSPKEDEDEKAEIQRGLIGSLVTHTFKYGNSLVDNIKKTTNGVAWRPQVYKSTG